MVAKGSFQHGKGLEHVFYKGKKYRIQSSGKYYYRNQDEHLLHRVIWIDHHGKIPRGYVIHHKDHNWRNNDISNLEMISKSEHGVIHGLEAVKARQYKVNQCLFCGNDFLAWIAKYCSANCYEKWRRRQIKRLEEKDCSS